MDKKYQISLNNSPDITVSYLLANDTSFAIFKNNVNDFLNFGGDSEKDGGRGISNREEIYKSYSSKEREAAGIGSINDINGETVVMHGTNFAVPLHANDYDLQISIDKSNLTVPEKTFTTFLSNKMYGLLSNPKFVQTNKYISKYSNIVEISSHISVWMYIRSINDIVDITNYVENVGTSSSKDSSSFSVTLSAINSINDTKNGMYTESVLYDDNGKQNSIFFFDKISSNDIIFISFESLNLDKDKRYYINSLSSKDLKGRVNDLIGLVDSVSKQGSASDTNISVSIQGRDLSKMMIDDGACFFPILFSQETADRLFVNLPEDQRPAKRLLLGGKIPDLFVYGHRSIGETVNFIMSYITNMGILRDNDWLLSSYSDNEVFKVPESAPVGGVTNYRPADGLWKIWEVCIDDSVKNRVLQDGSLILPEGSIMDLLKKACMEPLVEMFTDTYSDKFSLIIRKPPFDKEQILSYLNSQIRTPSTKNAVEGKYGTEYNDKTISLKEDDYKIDPVDDFFKREVKKTEPDISKPLPLVKIIDEVDIIAENLTFDDDNAFSWYRYTPRRDFVFENTTMASYLPIMYFPEYAEVFGMRRKEVMSNYVVFDPRNPNKKMVDNTYFSNQMVNDLAYIIETNVYLPFTKRGSIVLNGDRTIKKCTWIERPGTGEIYYVDSVSHDFSISGDTVDRTTTISVSRGMVKKYVKGANVIGKPKRSYAISKDEILSKEGGNSTFISYFNIVNIDLVKRMLGTFLSSNDPIAKDSSSTASGINKEVFNFFMEKRQFEDER